jgi:hypothetical protein
VKNKKKRITDVVESITQIITGWKTWKLSIPEVLNQDEDVQKGFELVWFGVHPLQVIIKPLCPNSGWEDSIS